MIPTITLEQPNGTPTFSLNEEYICQRIPIKAIHSIPNNGSATTKAATAACVCTVFSISYSGNMPPPTYFAILPSNILSFVNPIQVNICLRVQIYGKTKKDAREIHKISQKRGIIDVKSDNPPCFNRIHAHTFCICTYRCALKQRLLPMAHLKSPNQSLSIQLLLQFQGLSIT